MNACMAWHAIRHARSTLCMPYEPYSHQTQRACEIQRPQAFFLPPCGVSVHISRTCQRFGLCVCVCVHAAHLMLCREPQDGAAEERAFSSTMFEWRSKAWKAHPTMRLETIDNICALTSAVGRPCAPCRHHHPHYSLHVCLSRSACGACGAGGQ